jgi:tetratricopeptide (TPR) repeat protein
VTGNPVDLPARQAVADVQRAAQLISQGRYKDARDYLTQAADNLPDDPRVLDMAGNAWFVMGRYEQAWPLFERAVELSPNTEVFLSHKAACAVFIGKTSEAKAIYRKILKRDPRNQRVHYELAQLARAKDDRHVKQMLKALSKGRPTDNIFLYYALGKEYEDLGRWENAFKYYKNGGDAVKTLSPYRVAEDVGVIEAIIETCSETWLNDAPASQGTQPTPIFIVGLPRTGTTLTDRIVSSHSKVESAGESQLLQMVLRGGTRAGNQVGITPAQIKAAAKRDPAAIAGDYLAAVRHRLGEAPFFIEKLPENVLYLGFVAKSWPNARIVHLRRHPMDACFAMYKQSYFRFAYSLDDLAEYYLAYDRLSRHWRKVLGSRMIEVHYESLVTDQEQQTRDLLDKLGLAFEQSCLHFDTNIAPVATASSVQVREKVHARSVEKWKKFEKQLQPLKDRLQSGGVEV